GGPRKLRERCKDAISLPHASGQGVSGQPTAGLRAAQMMLYIMSSAPLVQQQQAPTRDKADSVIRAYLDARMASTDANDFLYQFDSSRDYDPSSRLAQIGAPALFINSADDQVNPPELGLAERLAAQMSRTRFILLPITAETRGHGTHSLPRVWGTYLAEFLASLPQR
ncbi:MAG: hypothetical protein ACK5BA_09660, partial [Gemmatimonas sp.]